MWGWVKSDISGRWHWTQLCSKAQWQMWQTRGFTRGEQQQDWTNGWTVRLTGAYHKYFTGALFKRVEDLGELWFPLGNWRIYVNVTLHVPSSNTIFDIWGISIFHCINNYLFEMCLILQLTITSHYIFGHHPGGRTTLNWKYFSNFKIVLQNKYNCAMLKRRTEESFLFFLGAKSIKGSKGSKRSSKGIQNHQCVELFKMTTLQMQICACSTLLPKEIDLFVNDNT